VKRSDYNSREGSSASVVCTGFTWTELRSTLRCVKELGIESLTCREYCQLRRRGNLPQRLIVFRIDVDRSPGHSLKMASIFADEGAAATLFFRVHSPDYDIFSPGDSRIVKAVGAMGFEVGLHCEPMVVSHLTGRTPESILKEDIDRLEGIATVKVYGAASHGDSRYPDINNLDFWKDHTPEELGLLYEAYDKRTFGLFQEGRYVSDSDLTRWKAYEGGKLLERDHRLLGEHIREGASFLYVLVHPFLFT
jgi:hypothetical protein